MKTKFLLLTTTILLIAGCGKNPEPKEPEAASQDKKTQKADTEKNIKEQKPCDSNSSIRKVGGSAPLKISFNSNIIDSSFKNIEYKKIEWNFGDNTISSEKNPVKVYEKTGLYPVTCTVEEEDGNSLVEKLLIEVSENENNTSYLFISVGEDITIQTDTENKDDTVLLKLAKKNDKEIKKIKIATGTHIYTLKGSSIDMDGFIRVEKSIKKRILSDIIKTKYCTIDTYYTKELRSTKLTKHQINKLLQN